MTAFLVSPFSSEKTEAQGAIAERFSAQMADCKGHALCVT